MIEMSDFLNVSPPNHPGAVLTSRAVSAVETIVPHSPAYSASGFATTITSVPITLLSTGTLPNESVLSATSLLHEVNASLSDEALQGVQRDIDEDRPYVSDVYVDGVLDRSAADASGVDSVHAVSVTDIRSDNSQTSAAALSQSDPSGAPVEEAALAAECSTERRARPRRRLPLLTPTVRTRRKTGEPVRQTRAEPPARGARGGGCGREKSHAELFRKDLISAMKLADTEVLLPTDYLRIADPWKLDWERGVQVPTDPDSIAPPSVVKLIACDDELGSHFELPPNRLLHADADADSAAALAAQQAAVCRYDADEFDMAWLERFNALRGALGAAPLTEDVLERVVEDLETLCGERLVQAVTTVDGLGIEYDDSVVCAVCHSPDGSEGNEMVFCDACDVCVHQTCYGISRVPPGAWMCRPCALGLRPRCELCPRGGGALKVVSGGGRGGSAAGAQRMGANGKGIGKGVGKGVGKSAGGKARGSGCSPVSGGCSVGGQPGEEGGGGARWAHISCAWWIPEVTFGCVERMEPIVNLGGIPASRWALVCCLCRERTGACIQCAHRTCTTAFHVTCAYDEGLDMSELPLSAEDKLEPSYQLWAFCRKHSSTDPEPRPGGEAHLQGEAHLNGETNLGRETSLGGKAYMEGGAHLEGEAHLGGETNLRGEHPGSQTDLRGEENLIRLSEGVGAELLMEALPSGVQTGGQRSETQADRDLERPQALLLLRSADCSKDAESPNGEVISAPGSELQSGRANLCEAVTQSDSCTPSCTQQSPSTPVCTQQSPSRREMTEKSASVKPKQTLRYIAEHQSEMISVNELTTEVMDDHLSASQSADRETATCVVKHEESVMDVCGDGEDRVVRVELSSFGGPEGPLADTLGAGRGSDGPLAGTLDPGRGSEGSLAACESSLPVRDLAMNGTLSCDAVKECRASESLLEPPPTSTAEEWKGSGACGVDSLMTAQLIHDPSLTLSSSSLFIPVMTIHSSSASQADLLTCTPPVSPRFVPVPCRVDGCDAQGCATVDGVQQHSERGNGAITAFIACSAAVPCIENAAYITANSGITINSDAEEDSSVIRSTVAHAIAGFSAVKAASSSIGVPVRSEAALVEDAAGRGEREGREGRMDELVAQFYVHVSAREVARRVRVDEEIVDFVHRYWTLKRRSLFNRPLLTPRGVTDGEGEAQQRQAGLVARMRMFIHLRQDLERVRNLCYMVNKRERMRALLHALKHQLFCALLRSTDSAALLLHDCLPTEEGSLFEGEGGSLVAEEDGGCLEGVRALLGGPPGSESEGEGEGRAGVGVKGGSELEEGVWERMLREGHRMTGTVYDDPGGVLYTAHHFESLHPSVAPAEGEQGGGGQGGVEGQFVDGSGGGGSSSATAVKSRLAYIRRLPGVNAQVKSTVRESEVLSLKELPIGSAQSAAVDESLAHSDDIGQMTGRKNLLKSADRVRGEKRKRPISAARNRDASNPLIGREGYCKKRAIDGDTSPATWTKATAQLVKPTSNKQRKKKGDAGVREDVKSPADDKMIDDRDGEDGRSEGVQPTGLGGLQGQAAPSPSDPSTLTDKLTEKHRKATGMSGPERRAAGMSGAGRRAAVMCGTDRRTAGMRGATVSSDLMFNLVKSPHHSTAHPYQPPSNGDDPQRREDAGGAGLEAGGSGLEAGGGVLGRVSGVQLVVPAHVRAHIQQGLAALARLTERAFELQRTRLLAAQHCCSSTQEHRGTAADSKDGDGERAGELGFVEPRGGAASRSRGGRRFGGLQPCRRRAVLHEGAGPGRAVRKGGSGLRRHLGDRTLASNCGYGLHSSFASNLSDSEPNPWSDWSNGSEQLSDSDSDRTVELN